MVRWNNDGAINGYDCALHHWDSTVSSGDDADFGGKFKQQPGDLWRPDPSTCTSDDTAPHSRGLLRVLNDEGEAKGEWDPKRSK